MWAFILIWGSLWTRRQYQCDPEHPKDSTPFKYILLLIHLSYHASSYLLVCLLIKVLFLEILYQIIKPPLFSKREGRPFIKEYFQREGFLLLLGVPRSSFGILPFYISSSDSISCDAQQLVLPARLYTKNPEWTSIDNILTPLPKVWEQLLEPGSQLSLWERGPACLSVPFLIHPPGCSPLWSLNILPWASWDCGGGYPINWRPG